MEEEGVLPFSEFLLLQKEYEEVQKLNPSKPETGDRAGELIGSFLHLWDKFKRGGFFSSNEELDEYSTRTLELFLIPYYVGNLHLMFQTERPQHLEIAIVYFGAFSDEMVRLGLSQKEAPEPTNPMDIRTVRVAEMKEKRELQKRIDAMNKASKGISERGQLSDRVDADVERELVLDVLRLSCLEARSNMRSSKAEIPFAKMHQDNVKPEIPKDPPKPMWVQRIGREEIRNKVFAPIEDIMPRPLPPDDETIAKPGPPPIDPDTENEEEREMLRKKNSKWDDWKDDHPPFSQE
jgi:hypothetical protein